MQTNTAVVEPTVENMKKEIRHPQQTASGHICVILAPEYLPFLRSGRQ